MREKRREVSKFLDVDWWNQEKSHLFDSSGEYELIWINKESYVAFSFDLLYGVTESEKFHILPPVALLHGMLDGQRDEVLRDHAKVNLLFINLPTFMKQLLWNGYWKPWSFNLRCILWNLISVIEFPLKIFESSDH